MKSADLNLIPIFIVIYEELSLSKAAKRLGISQPAVSKALKRLRDVYDDPLFHRSSQGVEATSFAMDVYPALLAALNNFNATLLASSEFDPKVSKKTFSIACVSAVGFEWFNRLIQLTQKSAPNIDFEIHPLFTQDYETDLRLQRYDLIIDITPSSHSNLKHEVLFTEKGYVICRKEHPRLVGNTLTYEAFFAEEHVAFSQWQVRGSILSEQHMKCIEMRKIRHRIPGAAEMLSLISTTDFIGILPISTVESFQALYPVKLLPLPFESAEMGVSVIWHPSRTQDAGHKWLREQLHKALEYKKNNIKYRAGKADNHPICTLL